jgi:hypothetical protein
VARDSRTLAGLANPCADTVILCAWPHETSCDQLAVALVLGCERSWTDWKTWRRSENLRPRFSGRHVTVDGDSAAGNLLLL